MTEGYDGPGGSELGGSQVQMEGMPDPLCLEREWVCLANQAIKPLSTGLVHWKKYVPAGLPCSKVCGIALLLPDVTKNFMFKKEQG